jgi:hypothetical protein
VILQFSSPAESSVLLASKKVPTFDVTAGSCSNRISLSADCSAGITALSYLDGGDLLVDLCLLVEGACVERMERVCWEEKEAGREREKKGVWRREK